MPKEYYLPANTKKLCQNYDSIDQRKNEKNYHGETGIIGGQN